MSKSEHISAERHLPKDLLDRAKRMEWDVPELRFAQARLARVVDRLKLSEDILEKLSFPKRAVVSSVPVRMENGKIKVFAGYLVIHSDTLGPCQGQLRYHGKVSLGEIAGLAMSQSWKSALMGLPLGGAQGGVRCDPNELSRKELQRITRRYTTEMLPMLGPEQNFLSPGLGTNEQIMAWMMDTYSQMKGSAVRQVVTGKPNVIGGSLGRADAPGRSAYYCIIELADKIKMNLDENTKVAIQGFGKLGQTVFRKLSEKGCKIIAVNDIKGGVHSEKGLDFDDLLKYTQNNRFVSGYPEGDSISNKDLLTLPCDFLIPAATGNQINEENASKIKAKIIIEGANEAISPNADTILEDNGIIVVPDLLANAGGVVVSYFEWVQGVQSYFWNEKEIYQRLYSLYKDSFNKVYQVSKKEKVDLRMAALMTGVSKVADATNARGLYP